MKKIWKVLLLLGFLLMPEYPVLAQEVPVPIKEYRSKNGFSFTVPEESPQISDVTKKRILLPEKFDYTFGDFETDIRDQGNTGLCWAYSASDVIAISSKKEFGAELLPSANYFNYYSAENAFSDQENPFSIGRQLSGGGNADYLFVQGALNNLGVLEEEFPTPLWKHQMPSIPLQEFYSQTDKKINAEIEKIVKIPGISYQELTEENRNEKLSTMKEYLYTYGALTTYYASEYSHRVNYYNSVTNSTFVPEEDIKQGLVPNNDDRWITSDHGIVIVGWDDNYSKENFVKKPQNNGAFKVKNSWGSSYHENGYFYMSYEDIYVLGAESIAVDISWDQYDHIKKYVSNKNDFSLRLKNQSNECWIANTYSTKNQSEMLKAVSLWADTENLAYEIYYLDGEIEKNKVVSINDSLELLAVGTIRKIGAERIEVPATKIASETTYSIVVKYNYPKELDSYNLPIQKVKNGKGNDRPLLEEGKSYYNNMDDPNRQYWLNLSDGELYADGGKFNLWINAYTDDITIEKIAVTPEKGELIIGEQLMLNVSIVPEDASNRMIQWSSSDNSIAVVDENGVVTGLKGGQVTITATTEDGSKSAVCEVSISDAKGTFGTVPWTWIESTQTLIFGKGEFPNTNTNQTIQTQIETQLKGNKIQKIIFTDYVQANLVSEYLFSELLELDTIENLEKLDVSQVKSMESMFSGAVKLEKAEFDQWDTSNVTNMSRMFYRTHGLIALDLNNWDTSKVTDMWRLFQWATDLETLEVGNWNTSSVMNMQETFSHLENVKNLDISNWDMRKANVSNMLGNMYNIEKLKLGEYCIMKGSGLGENIKAPYSGSWISPNGKVEYLTSDELKTNYEGSQSGLYQRTQDDYYGTVAWEWEDTTQTVSLSEGRFPDGGNSTGIQTHIENSPRLNGKKIRKICFTDTVEAAKHSGYLFSNLTELENIEGLHLLTTMNVENMESMFLNDAKLTDVEVKQWDTGKVTNMASMFKNAKALTKLELNNWDTSKVKKLNSVFMGAEKLNEIAVSNWNTSSVTDMSSVFDGVVLLEKVGCMQWDTSNVTNMSRMFYRTHGLTDIDLNDWDTSKVTDMWRLFQWATNLETLEVGNWNTSNVVNMQETFSNVESIKKLDISNWDMKKANVSNMLSRMFNLEKLVLGENCILKNSGLNENSQIPYTGSWINNDGAAKYQNSQEFVNNYDGSLPGVYVREKTEY